MEEKRYYAVFQSHWQGFDGGIALLSQKEFTDNYGLVCNCRKWLFTIRSETKENLMFRIYKSDSNYAKLHEAQEELIRLIFTRL